MSNKTPEIPPMPKRLMLVPIIVGVFSAFVGILEFNHENNTLGWIFIIVGILMIVVNYFIRRDAWRNLPSYRARQHRNK